LTLLQPQPEYPEQWRGTATKETSMPIPAARYRLFDRHFGRLDEYNKVTSADNLRIVVELHAQIGLWEKPARHFENGGQFCLNAVFGGEGDNIIRHHNRGR
jgi:hypothetical protein